MVKSSARDVAVSALSAFRKRGAWSDGFLKNAIRLADLDRRDAALATTLVYGVLQNKLLCDFYITSYSSLKPNKIAPKIFDILRVGVYQLIFLDKIPHSAAVNEAVTQARRDNPRAAGFVNAVLRKISRSKDNLPALTGDDISILSLKYSHPEWLVKRFINVFGADEAEKLMASNNKIAPITARINPVKGDIDRAIEMLTKQGAEARTHEWLQNCIYISASGNIEELDAYKEGLITIQDTASQLAALSSGVTRGQKVMDACSAPGGKAFILAEMMENNGSVLACDIYDHKKTLIEEGAKRLGLSCIEAKLCDAAEYHNEFDKAFDFVLADVPCSGLGIIRKKPDIRYKTEEEISELPKLQSAILHNVSRYVLPGGTLIYSTCTILPEENEKIVDAFLSEKPDFSYEDFDLPQPIGKIKGFITLLPQMYNTDGFFISKLRRKK